MDSIPQKQCSNPDCQQWFPATSQYFDRDRYKKDGLDPRCKGCRKTYREAHKERYRARISSAEHKAHKSTYRKTPVQREHARNYARQYRQTEYSKAYRQDYAARYKATHKDEIIERSHQYYLSHAEESHERNRQWRKTEKGRLSGQVKKHKRKAQKLASGGSYTVEQIQDLLKRQKQKCYYCKAKLAQYHIEHIVPLSRGGSNDISNIVLSCPTCNMSKHDRLPHEWHRGGHLL